MKHFQYDYVLATVKAGLSPLLIGESGTGKSTIAKAIADDLNIPFYVITGTYQTSQAAFLGFYDVNSNYSPTLFRKAVEFGGIFVIEELTAMDPNTILCLNSLDNGFVPFPDGVIDVHPDFHLIATANPVTVQYGARANLDFSTLNRYYTIKINYDQTLASNIASTKAIDDVTILRDFLKSYGSSITLTMRDEILYDKLLELGLDDNPLLRLIDNTSDELKQAFTAYLAQIEEDKRKRALTQADMTTFDELKDRILYEAELTNTGE